MATPDAFGGKREGWRFTAAFEPRFADPGTLRHQKYTYGGIVEHHGFRLSNGGGWSLYRAGDVGARKSYRAKVKRYRARLWRWLVLDSVVEIKEGWD